MNSKERLLKCIRHEPIDRVPISTFELVGWNEFAWENQQPSYKALMDIIRKETDCIYMLNPDILEERNHDHIHTYEWIENNSNYKKMTYKWKNKNLTYTQRSDDGINTIWTIEHLLKNLDDIDTYLALPYKPAKINIKNFYDEQNKLGDKGLMMITLADPVCEAASLFEMSRFLEIALTEPEKMQYFLDAIHERQMHLLREMLSYNMNDVIFRICGSEYITPPYFSPEYFSKYCTKYLIEICESIKHAGGIARIHCHGKIGKIIEQFAKTDADMLEPLEPIPDGDIDLSEVKKMYGDKFCLMGNIELKELENSEPKRIDQIVNDCMKKAKNGSGYILMPTAAPINDPLSKNTEINYYQMIESVAKYGVY